MAETLDVRLPPDLLAKTIAEKWVSWNSNRNGWVAEKKELREYLFATDTRKTSNAQLPWKNSTVTPKLTQLRDNLHANYMAALFPNDDWFIWDAEDESALTAEKKTAITSYMKSKLREGRFETVVSQLVYDYIDYGNVFVGHAYVNNVKKDPETGEDIVVFRGPNAFRVSPLDVVFDLTASTFDRSPFIRRVVKTVGDFKKDVMQSPNANYNQATIDKVFHLRGIGTVDFPDLIKNEGLVVDGFGNFDQYVRSGMIEILEFWGDCYDTITGELLLDHVVKIVDRKWILLSEPNKSWLGVRPYFHCGWRLRPDNLWAQGPLDQLVGMQYRIDHLENLKADVFDLIAHPVVVIEGSTVEDFKWGPGQTLFVGDEGKAYILHPETAALQADMQIHDLMQKMEELAGAPREAMGIRSPGEKTKYEVQTLQNGAGRIFQAKVSWFERNVLEPLLNSMLEDSRRNMGASEPIKVKDPTLGVEAFIDITKEDILAKGTLYAVGARHFAEQAKFVQELQTTLQVYSQIPSVAPHISGWGVAQALDDALGWQRYEIVKQNVAVSEQLETQRLMQAGTEAVQSEAGIPAEPQEGDSAQVHFGQPMPNVPGNK